jgi:hypothetical protein
MHELGLHTSTPSVSAPLWLRCSRRLGVTLGWVGRGAALSASGRLGFPGVCRLGGGLFDYQQEPGYARSRREVIAMKYLFLLYGLPLPEPGTDAAVELMEAYGTATAAMDRAGVLIDCAPLQPVSAATTLRVRGDQTLLTDGPAAEIKEHFGGYTLVEGQDLDEALSWAATLPAARDGAVEIRPVIDVRGSS